MQIFFCGISTLHNMQSAFCGYFMQGSKFQCCILGLIGDLCPIIVKRFRFFNLPRPVRSRFKLAKCCMQLLGLMRAKCEQQKPSPGQPAPGAPTQGWGGGELYNGSCYADVLGNKHTNNIGWRGLLLQLSGFINTHVILWHVSISYNCKTPFNI